MKQQKSQPLYKGAIEESNVLKSRTIKSSLKKSFDRTSCAVDVQAKSVTLPKEFDGEMSRMLCCLLRQQSAPDADIQIHWNASSLCQLSQKLLNLNIECQSVSYSQKFCSKGGFPDLANNRTSQFRFPKYLIEYQNVKIDSEIKI